MSILNLGQFSWRRLGLFIKSDLVLNAPKIFTLTITVFVALLFYSLFSISPIGSQVDNFHPDLFVFALFGGGLWFTSHSFADLNHHERSSFFLLLPASNVEKLVGRWLLTSLGYIMGVISVFYLVSFLTAAFTWLIIGDISVIFRPLHQDLIRYFSIYMFFHSVFLLGAIYFKSSNFSKTILYMCALVLVFFFVAFIVFMSLLGIHLIEGWQVLSFYSGVIGLISAIVIVPGAWLTTYLRLCESGV
ncbi:MAG: hypothetical protein KKE11_01420 [Gammaproteobacteria bacterium]|nr:hypothetical protein [Gammaproteobacteria bacterium]